MKTVSPECLAQIFVEVADTLVDEFDLTGFLHRLTLRVADLVGSSVGTMLADQEGHLQFVAASDEPAKGVGIFQVQTREGPCQQAYRTGTPVNADLRTADPRWPRLAAPATAAGFSSVHAFPLRVRHQVLGTLDVFGHEAGGVFDDVDTAVVQALADVAAIGLLQQRTISSAEALTGHLQAALNTRIVIEQAKGAIAQAREVSVDIAFGILRDYARSHRRQLGAVAHAAITDPAMFAALTNPSQNTNVGPHPGDHEPMTRSERRHCDATSNADIAPCHPRSCALC